MSVVEPDSMSPVGLLLCGIVSVKFLNYIYLFVHLYVCVSLWTTFRSPFSPTVWVPAMEFGL